MKCGGYRLARNLSLKKPYRIAIMPGDGIGKEVMGSAINVINKLKLEADLVHADIGWKFWCEEGNALPERTLNILRTTDCCLFGAITSKPIESAQEDLAPHLKNKGLVYSSPIVGMRQTLNLHSNMRPCRALPGNPLNHHPSIDLVVFRENTEDLYAGVEFHPVPDPVREVLNVNHKKMSAFETVSNHDMAITLRIITKRGTEAVVRQAFQYARSKGIPLVTVCEKANVLRQTSGLFIRTAKQLAALEFPELKLQITNIDAQCAALVQKPQEYKVIVTSNLFGDILSDLAAEMVGGLGFAPSANLGDNYAVFEPTHGSAPDIEGKGIANPLAMISSTKMMLDWLGEVEKADRLQLAIESVIKEGKIRTKDMGGNASTLEMTKAILDRL